MRNINTLLGERISKVLYEDKEALDMWLEDGDPTALYETGQVARILLVIQDVLTKEI